MALDLTFLAIGIAVAGYFIGHGLKNFKNPDARSSFGDAFADEPELIKEKDVPYYLGISKEDARLLTEEYPNIPHFTINDNVYYSRTKLREWIKNI